MSSVQGDGSGDLVTIRDSAYFFRVPSIAATDLRGIIRFQHVAMAGDRSDPLPRPVLLALADLVPADMVEYFEMRRDQSAVAYSTDHDVREPAGVADAVTELGRLNPVGAFRWTPADGPIRLSETVDDRALAASEWYDAYLRPMRIRDTLKVWLSSSPQSVACVSLDRSDGDFSDRDAAVLAILQPHLAAMRRRAIGRDAPPRDNDLRVTMREAEVLTWVVRGKRNEEIGRLLFISSGTVEKHLEHAFRKLGVHSRGEAIAQMLDLDSAAGEA